MELQQGFQEIGKDGQCSNEDTYFGLPPFELLTELLELTLINDLVEIVAL